MYRRIEQHQGHQHITEVTEAGKYEQWEQWPDGITMGYYKTTLQEMGWESLKQFLNARPGFEKVS